MWKSQNAEGNFSNGKGGRREDLDGLYVRSRWEANWARYLNWLVEMGEVERWEYEPDVFEFPVKRGSKFYTPDFKVYNSDGSIEYHEVKGYMDQKSRTKLDRMRRHFPEVRLVIIERDTYYDVANKIGRSLPEWEVADGKR